MTVPAGSLYWMDSAGDGRSGQRPCGAREKGLEEDSHASYVMLTMATLAVLGCAARVGRGGRGRRVRRRKTTETNGGRSDEKKKKGHSEGVWRR